MNWDFGDGKSQLIVLAFNQMYQIVNASAASRDGEMKIANTTLKGDDIDFFLTVGAANYRFSGKVQGDSHERHRSHRRRWQADRMERHQAAAGKVSLT